jgi:CHAD domain-containing protein
MNHTEVLHGWAHELVAHEANDAAQALRRYCRKRSSSKRLHRFRRSLARLRSAIDDLGDRTAIDPQLRDRVDELHRRTGKIRDADVLIVRLKAYRKRAGRQERREVCAVARALKKRRKRAGRKLRRLLKRASVLKA